MFHDFLFLRVQFPFPVALGLYFAVYAFFIWGLWYIRQRPKKLGFYKRWSTQDFLVIGIMAVLLFVWDDLLANQIISPFDHAIPVVGPVLSFLQFHDLPYMFLLMVGVAMVRKPGIMISMIFIKDLLQEIMFSHHGVNPLHWMNSLSQGVLGDMYIVWVKGQIFSNPKRYFWDGLVLGFFRAVPNTPIGGMVMDPVLNGVTHTILHFWWDVVGNGVGNGLEAALTAPLAVRVARSVQMLVGQDPMGSQGGTMGIKDDEWNSIGGEPS